MSLLGNLIFTIGVGRLMVFAIQSLPIIQDFKKPKYFAELFHCDFCLGTWVLFVFVVMFKSQVTTELTGIYIPVISEFLTAVILSFMAHLMLLGARFRWGNFDAD